MTNRQPKGTPVGGQFAEGRKPEGADLAFVNPDFSVRNEAENPMALIRDNVKVELEDIGEGLSGDYNEDDPDDISLLRFSVYVKTDDPDYAWADGWKAVDDASYCTNLPTDLSPEQTQVALNALMNEFHNVLHNDPETSVKGLGEQMSWIGPGDLKSLPIVFTPEQEEVANAYKTAALWATTGDDEEPLDAEYSIDQISEESNEEIAKDVVEFWERAKAEGLTEHWTPGQFGHDFYLTRAGHGAGFWDRGFGYAGERLTEMAKSYKEKTPIVGDDGSIYFE